MVVSKCIRASESEPLFDIPRSQLFLPEVLPDAIVSILLSSQHAAKEGHAGAEAMDVFGVLGVWNWVYEVPEIDSRRWFACIEPSEDNPYLHLQINCLALSLWPPSYEHAGRTAAVNMAQTIAIRTGDEGLKQKLAMLRTGELKIKESPITFYEK